MLSANRFVCLLHTYCHAQVGHAYDEPNEIKMTTSVLGFHSLTFYLFLFIEVNCVDRNCFQVSAPSGAAARWTSLDGLVFATRRGKTSGTLHRALGRAVLDPLYMGYSTTGYHGNMCTWQGAVTRHGCGHFS